MIAPYVLSRIGEGQARALFVTGEPFGATRAQQMGLLHAVAPPDALDAVDDVLRELDRGLGAAVARPSSARCAWPARALRRPSGP